MQQALAKCCTLLITALGIATGSHAQTYPNRPITLVMPYSAGTGIDSATRVFAEKLRQHLGQAAIVQNKVGAAGNIGTEFVARAPADGYTLLVVANTLAMNPSLYKNLPYDPQKDLVPISLLFKGAMVLLANQNVSAQHLPEFIAAAKKAPGKLNYASTGVGTPQHLAMELLKSTTGMNVLHIPHKGAAEAVTSIVSGQVEIGFVPIQSALVQIASGKVHALAVSSPQRQAALPDVPTVAEALGKPFDVDLWYGLFAPAGTPPPVLQKLNQEVRSALGQAEAQRSLAAQGMTATPSTAGELKALVTADIKRWAQVIDAAGIRTD